MKKVYKPTPFRVFRITAGLTQAELAKKLNVTQGTIGNYEHLEPSKLGEQASYYSIVKIAQILECEPSDLVKDIN